MIDKCRNNNNNEEKSLQIPLLISIDNSRIRKAFNKAYQQAIYKLQNIGTYKHNYPIIFIHGASVLEGNRVIGSGYNNLDRNYVQGRFYLSIHAELSAILESSIPAVYNDIGRHKHHDFSTARKPYKARRNNHKNFRQKIIKNYRTSHFELLVIRINKQGQLRNSRPCIMCIEDMRRYNVKRVFYTDDNGQIVYENISQMIPSTTDTRLSYIRNRLH